MAQQDRRKTGEDYLAKTAWGEVREEGRKQREAHLFKYISMYHFIFISELKKIRYFYVSIYIDICYHLKNLIL